MNRIDIHRYEKRLHITKRMVESSALSNEDKKLILEFDKLCVVEGLGLPRREKHLRHLLDLATRFLSVPLAKATKKDLQDAVALIEQQSNYSPYTKRDVKISTRKFFKWLVYRDDYLNKDGLPDLVAWIKPAVKRKDVCRIRASDLLTPQEVERLLRAAPHPRDRAFIALSYEVGGRIGEIGSLRAGDVERDQYSFSVDLDGKTGKRHVRVVLYASHLATWLNLHPERDDPAAPLWPRLYKERPLMPLYYPRLLAIVHRTAKRAGIRKRVFPHLFRYSRATHLLASGHLNEAQAKVYFGWVPDSKMLSTYAHLVTRDANDAILRMYGIQKERTSTDARPMLCGMCSSPNPRDGKFCFRCGYALSMSAPDQTKLRIEHAESIIHRLLKRSDVQEILRKMQSDADDDHADELPPTDPPAAEPTRGRRAA
jgi:integrase/recombinase XerD